MPICKNEILVFRARNLPAELNVIPSRSAHPGRSAHPIYHTKSIILKSYSSTTLGLFLKELGIYYIDTL
jgi:hypothetical protein